MAIRTIVQKGDDILTKKCKDITEFDSKLHTLLDDMKDTMFSANGVGLAAPQIGIMRSVAVVLDIDTEQIYELINPKIIESSGENNDIEGCLSIPGVYGYVVRPSFVRVECVDRYGMSQVIVGNDFLARAFNHEIDHLHGKLFDDLVSEFVDIDDLEDA